MIVEMRSPRKTKTKRKREQWGKIGNTSKVVFRNSQRMTRFSPKSLVSKYLIICCHVDKASRIFPEFFSFHMVPWHRTGSQKQLASV